MVNLLLFSETMQYERLSYFFFSLKYLVELTSRAWPDTSFLEIFFYYCFYFFFNDFWVIHIFWVSFLFCLLVSFGKFLQLKRFFLFI